MRLSVMKKQETKPYWRDYSGKKVDEKSILKDRKISVIIYDMENEIGRITEDIEFLSENLELLKKELRRVKK